MNQPDDVFLEGYHCNMRLRQPTARVVVLQIVGRDIGELGDRPFTELDRRLAAGSFELFVDTRDALGPSIDVSSLWAGWLMKNREKLVRVNMLTRHRFIQLTADFVQKFAKMEERMRIYTDVAAFETALSLAVAESE